MVLNDNCDDDDDDVEVDDDDDGDDVDGDDVDEMTNISGLQPAGAKMSSYMVFTFTFETWVCHLMFLLLPDQIIAVDENTEPRVTSN